MTYRFFISFVSTDFDGREEYGNGTMDQDGPRTDTWTMDFAAIQGWEKEAAVKIGKKTVRVISISPMFGRV